MAHWSEEQVRALKALGIPLFELEHGESVTSPEPEPTPPQETHHESITYYQVGGWTLSFPAEVPVPRFQWLEDLSRAFDTRPTQVNRPDNKAIVDCTAYTKSALSPEEKRALWAKLKPLMQS